MGRMKSLSFTWGSTLALILIAAFLIDTPIFLTAAACSLLGSAAATTVFILKGDDK